MHRRAKGRARRPGADHQDTLLRAGFQGLIAREAPAALLRSLLAAAGAGYLVCPAALTPVLAATAAPNPGDDLGADPGLDLTGRGWEIFHLLHLGLSNRQIAEALHISPSTVKWYVSNLLTQLRVSNRVQAARLYPVLSPRLHET
ncbi:LuxR C-terminal-related transcriptional regulator [Streptomyces sp. TRM68367]|uniref:helix-turn-helix transcriptional regulator n=1 Tax=Streptomyces sp. TRM68367 TaxID=2758415 RepID=UPI00165AA773|nr:response regulator transcription factor [Streptomyces sp. TRM68367]